jgi:hypothetical protein
VLTRRLAALLVVGAVLAACSVDGASNGSTTTTSTTTTTTTIPTLPTAATTPTMVYGVIPDAQWIECGRAWLWVTQPGLEKPLSITRFEQRIVRDRLDEPFLAVGFALVKAFVVDEVHPPGVIYSLVERSPAYPKMIRAWTNVARACRALVQTVAAGGAP